MGSPREPDHVRLIAGLLVSSPDLLAEVHGLLAEAFSPVEGYSEPQPWTVSDYYAAEMGDHLWRQFVSCRDRMRADQLGAIKLRTNALEGRWRDARGRRVNIDPGYLAPLKLVLATTKDAAHRIYIGDGIFAEVTLRYEHGTFRRCEHTYPDYAAPEAIAFFNRVRRRG